MMGLNFARHANTPPCNNGRLSCARSLVLRIYTRILSLLYLALCKYIFLNPGNLLTRQSSKYWQTLDADGCIIPDVAFASKTSYTLLARGLATANATCYQCQLLKGEIGWTLISMVC